MADSWEELRTFVCPSGLPRLITQEQAEEIRTANEPYRLGRTFGPHDGPTPAVLHTTTARHRRLHRSPRRGARAVPSPLEQPTPPGVRTLRRRLSRGARSGARRSYVMIEGTTVNRFDPSKYITKVSGRDYIEVKLRLVWLRTDYPDASIETEHIELTNTRAVFKASVTLSSGASASGYGSETPGDFGGYIEKAETKAIGRALGALGFGTQFTYDFDEGSHHDGTPNIVDSPAGRQQPQRIHAETGSAPYQGGTNVAPATADV